MTARVLAVVLISVAAIGGALRYVQARVAEERALTVAAPTTAPAALPRPSPPPAPVRAPAAPAAAAPADASAAPPAPSPATPAARMLFRRTSIDAHAGVLAWAPVADLSAITYAEPLRCERVHMAAGRGVCLTADRGMLTTYAARLFDAAFTPGQELPLAGVPSRVQVAPDGRTAGITVFMAGHGYSEGGFSTRTSLLDLASGTWVVDDLESLTVRENGEVRTAADFNFWGVTFAHDRATFYATLGTGGRTLLVRGRLGTGEADVIAEGVECPSLSPDDRHVAFKQRVAGGIGPARWRVAVLDLATGVRRTLAETRDVDDQVQWLDRGTITYALPSATRPGEMDTWAVAADGRGEPRLLLPQSYSAAVIR